MSIITPSISKSRTYRDTQSYERSLLSKISAKPDGASNRGGYITFIGLLYQITLGLLWSYGNVIPYVASYMTNHNGSCTESNYNDYYSITNYSFFLLFTSLTFGAILGGKVELYFGPSISIIISSSFVSIGFGGTCLALLLNNIYMILLFYGILFGLGIGLGYPVLVIVCMRWFPEHQGRVCGIISAVFGGSPLIWDFVQEEFVNPHNYKMDDKVGYCLQNDVIHNIPYMFLYIALIAILMQIISLFCVKNPSWYTPERENDENDDEIEKSDQQLEYEKDSLTVQQSIRTGTFWTFWINNFIYSYVLMFVAAEWKEFGMEYLQIANDDYLSVMGSIGALSNGIGRFSWGFFYDFNKSFRISMGAQTFIVAVFVATLPILKFIPFLDTNSLFAVWICAIWICVGCQYGFLPTCVAHTFGAKYTGSIVGLFIWCEAPASLLVVIVTQYKDILFNGWFIYTIFMGICSFLSTILSVLTKEKLNRKQIIHKYEQTQKLNLLLNDIDERFAFNGTPGAESIGSAANNASLRSKTEDSSLVWVPYNAVDPNSPARCRWQQGSINSPNDDIQNITFT